MNNKSGNYQLLIEKLDHFIRKFYLNKTIRGALYSIGFILLFFLLITTLEHYFYFEKNPRKLLFFSFLVGSFAALAFWVVNPFLRYFKLGKVISHEQAAQIIGDHFGNVKDKLLNILQLKKQAESHSDNSLLLASIDQKSEDIKIVPFRSAINLQNNRKYLKYSLPPLLILLVLLFAAPSVITNSTHRLINNNKDFDKEAPFHFGIKNEELKGIQYESFTLDVEVNGNILPNEAFISIDEYVYRLQKTDNNKYAYTFNNLQKNTSFSLFAGKVNSSEYTLSVIEKPVIIDFTLDLDYPAYTKRKDEVLSNNGNVVVPEGTKIGWEFNTENTESVEIKLKNKVEALERKSGNLFNYTGRIYKPTSYKLFVSNAELPSADSVQYSIQIIPDQYPTIDVELFKDSLDKDLIYFIGDATDDYGIRAITFNYRISEENAGPVNTVEISNPNSNAIQYQYAWDKSSIALQPGQKLSYYFEVFDNDGINGSKSSKTRVFEDKKPSIEEYEAENDNNNQDIKADLKKSLEESKKLKEEIKKLREKLLQKKELGWEEKKELEKLLERQQELEKILEKAKEKFNKNQENQNEFTEPSEELLEKQEKMEELFEDVMNEEMQSLMEEIKNLMQELQKDEALEMMQEMEYSDQEMEMNLDRMLELFKQLELEQKMQDQIQNLEDLAEKQEELSEDTKSNSKEQDELKKEQEEINDEFEKIKEEQKEIEEKNQELERPREMENLDEQQENISKELENSSESLEKEQNNKASKSQKNASEQMQEMAEQMSSQMQSAQMEQMQEDMQALRQLLENLVNLSFDQESLIKDLSRSRVNTPRYIGLVQQQHKLQGDFQLIQDSLLALSKRVMQIESFVTDKVVAVNENMDYSLTKLEERQKSPAADNQQRVMTNVNDLALMLNEAMKQMQQQMAGMMSGSQMCSKPGSKPGQSPSDKMTKANQMMGEQMQKMKDAMDKKEGEEGLSSEQFAKMAARQAAMRKMLREIQNEQSEKGEGSKELEQLQNELNKIEIDLVNKQLTNEMLKRQQEIKTRLLEAEKAERQRGEKEKRKAEVASEKSRDLPPSLKEYLKKRESEIEDFKLISPDVKPYYKLLINGYVKSLSSER